MLMFSFIIFKLILILGFVLPEAGIKKLAIKPINDTTTANPITNLLSKL